MGAWNEATLLARPRSKLASLSVAEPERDIAWLEERAAASERRELLPLLASLASAVWRVSSASILDRTDGRTTAGFERMSLEPRRSPIDCEVVRVGDLPMTLRGVARACATIGGVCADSNSGDDLSEDVSSSGSSERSDVSGEVSVRRDLIEARFVTTVARLSDVVEGCR